MSSAPSCATCRFCYNLFPTYICNSRTPTGDLAGECRRRAPGVITTKHAEGLKVFPRVWDSDWCGDYELSAASRVAK